MRRARRDLMISRYNCRGKTYDASAFYAQQATEKALKALSIEMNGKFKRSHDLVELASDVEAPTTVLKMCAIRSPAYTVSRHARARQQEGRDGCLGSLEGGGEMGTIPAEVTRRVKSFKKRASRIMPIERLIVFGSFARGDAGPDSDVDMIIVSR